MNNMEEYWKTTDISLAASLEIYGHRIRDISGGVYNSRAEFIFDDNDRLRQQVGDYWNGGMRVDPQEFSNTLRKLKSRINS